MNAYFSQIVDFVRRLPVQQRLAIGGVLIGAIVVLISVAYWANKPDYALLFGNLDQSDAGQVVENLKGRGVDYELRDSGSAVYVPREDVYELRLSLAGAGVVTDGQQGYELFDRGTLGMTDFMQRVSMRRAMEGELTRTISSLRQVEAARVHLVMPERSPFRETQVRPSASVVLKLSAGSTLALGQVDGISALVAGAVEGLESSDVTVLDTQGNVLSTGGDDDSQTTLSTTQLEMQRNVEEGLVAKGQSMLDQVLGAGNSIVRVSASLDFSRTVSNREIIDPESATVVSEEKIDERTSESTGANSSIRNYEMTRTTETHEKGIGTIDYLTVSVILNQRPKTAATPDGDAPAEPIYEVYTDQQIAEIEDLVRNTVGFDPDRGDRIAIHQTRFESAIGLLDEDFLSMEEQDQLAEYLRYGLIALALVFAFLLVRRAGRQVTQLSTEQAGSGQLSRGPYTTPEALAARQGRVLTGGEAPYGMAPDASPRGGRVPDGHAEAAVSQDHSRALAQLKAPGEQDDIFQEKLEMDARLKRSENPLFDQVRNMVDAAPEDAAAVIREWLSRDLMSV